MDVRWVCFAGASCLLALSACGADDDDAMMMTQPVGGGSAAAGGSMQMSTAGVSGSAGMATAGSAGTSMPTSGAGASGMAGGSAGASGMGGRSGTGGMGGRAGMGGMGGMAGMAGMAGGSGMSGMSGMGGMGGMSGAGMGGSGGTGMMAGATFTEVYGIIMAKCGGGSAGCHVGGASGGLRMPNKMTAHMNLVGVDSGECAGEKRVVAGNPAMSVLVKAVKGTACVQRMPQGRAALTADEIAKIESWVMAGAMNN